MRRDGGGLRRVGFGGSPAWSPDGRQLALVRNWSLEVINADGTGRRRLVAGRSQFADTVSHPAWSPDGHTIAFAYDNSRYRTYLETARPDGTHRRRIVELNQNNSRGLAWSPDGSLIAFADETSDASSEGIFVINADGTSKRAVTTVDGLKDPHWLPDGRSIAFGVYDEGIYVIGLDGSARRSLVRDPAAAHFDLSRDGHFFAFTDNRRLIVLSFDGRRRQTVLAGGSDDSPAWSRDGRRIAFMRDYEGLVILDTRGRRRVVPSTLRASCHHSLSWNPAGTKIACTEESFSGIQIVDIRTGQATRPLYDHGAGDVGKADPSWSPDGKNLAYVEDDTDLSLYSLATHRTRTLVSVRQRAADPEWSPDGRRIAFTRGRASARPAIYVFTLADRSLRRLAEGTDPSWSPDGRKVAFERRHGGDSDIYVIGVNGRGLYALTENAYSDYAPAWRPAKHR